MPEALPETIAVQLPSKAWFQVITEEEAEYLIERVRRYEDENIFVNVSDQQDVDRMLMMEVLFMRDGIFLSQGCDYRGEAVDEQGLRRSMVEASRELRQVKKLLGIDKAARDRTKGDGSIPVFVQDILTRAKAFGFMRNKQAAKAIELVMELQALVTLWKNCDAQEQQEQHCTQDEIFGWIQEVLIPEFTVIDAAFRAGEQAMWIRSM